MSDKVTLSKREIERLTSNRKKLVTSDRELAMAKLIYERRFEEYMQVDDACSLIETEHPWLLSAELYETDNVEDPTAGIIAARYQQLCLRRDNLALQLGNPKIIQETIVKQEDARIKAGTLIPAAEAMAILMKLMASAGKYMPLDKRQAFTADFQEIRAEFMENNPGMFVLDNK